MLVIDTGNTYLTLALFDEESLVRRLRIETRACLEAGTLWDLLPEDARKHAARTVFASVREDITAIVTRDLSARSGHEVLVVDRHTSMGIDNAYKTPDTLGIDRLINAAAALHLYGDGRTPLAIIDMGSASTVDYVSGSGAFLGGAIVPGVLNSWKGLKHGAPALPEFPLELPPATLGTDTISCLQSGVLTGHVCCVTGLAARMAEERDEHPLVIVTGGALEFLAPLFPAGCLLDADLTLKGLALLGRRAGGQL